jgi:hypothetical protein
MGDEGGEAKTEEKKEGGDKGAVDPDAGYILNYCKRKKEKDWKYRIKIKNILKLFMIYVQVNKY